MKKLKVVFGILAFVTAIGAAFATKSSEAFATQGYIQNGGPTSCSAAISCNDVSGPQCSVDAKMLWKFNSGGTQCNVALKRDN